jgi:MHS family alpha-ketoglutarate permease-like MFS transporter
MDPSNTHTRQADSPAASAPARLVEQQLSTARAIGNTIKGSLGNLVEWYDVYTYTVFVSYFEAQFFDPKDTNSTIYAYAVFAITFLMRPLGSWWFGRYADRHGRRSSLTLSVSVMAVASGVIAILPTRAYLGAWAAAGLVLCRLVQGFATGGEYGTSATYMSEAATRNRRGFFSSFQYVTLVGGHVLAQLTLLIMTFSMPQESIKAWGWRIPFALGGVTAVIVFWLRRTMDESLSKEHLQAIESGKDKRSGTLRELLSNHMGPLVKCFLITLGGTIVFYTYSVNAPAMIKTAYKATPQLATWINFGALVLLMAIQPLGGLLSDKVGRKPLLIFFGIGCVAFTHYFITNLSVAKDPVTTITLVTIAFVILTGYTSINALVKAELFPATIRALGVGLGYGLANSVFGGTAPLIYQWARKTNQVPAYIGYVISCVAVSLVVYVFFLKNKSTTELDHEQGLAFEPKADGAGA